MTSWNNAQAPGWNSADAELSYGPLHRSQPLDDRIPADASITQTELVQYMEDAGTVDLRGDKLVPVIAQLLGSPPATRTPISGSRCSPPGRPPAPTGATSTATASTTTPRRSR